MLQSLYAAASGMEAQQNQFNAISNDMANIDTPGYQATRMGFEDLLYTSAGSASGSPAISTGAGSASTIVGRSDAQGAIQSTGPLARRRHPGPRLPPGAPRRRLGRPDPQRRAPGQLPGRDHQPAGQPPGPGRSSSPRAPTPTTSRSSPTARSSTARGPSARSRWSPSRLPTSSSPTATACTASPPAAAPRAPPPAPRSSRAPSRAPTSTSAEDMSEMITAQRSYEMASKAVQYQDQMLQIADGIKQ